VDHLLHEIVRTAEHAAIYRMIGAMMHEHDLSMTLLIGAVIVVGCVLLLRPRRSRY